MSAQLSAHKQNCKNTRACHDLLMIQQRRAGGINGASGLDGQTPRRAFIVSESGSDLLHAGALRQKSAQQRRRRRRGTAASRRSRRVTASRLTRWPAAPRRHRRTRRARADRTAQTHCFFICISGGGGQWESAPTGDIYFVLNAILPLAGGRRAAGAPAGQSTTALRASARAAGQLATEIIAFFLWSARLQRGGSRRRPRPPALGQCHCRPPTLLPRRQVRLILHGRALQPSGTAHSRTEHSTAAAALY